MSAIESVATRSSGADFLGVTVRHAIGDDRNTGYCSNSPLCTASSSSNIYPDSSLWLSRIAFHYQHYDLPTPSPPIVSSFPSPSSLSLIPNMVSWIILRVVLPNRLLHVDNSREQVPKTCGKGICIHGSRPVVKALYDTKFREEAKKEVAALCMCSEWKENIGNFSTARTLQCVLPRKKTCAAMMSGLCPDEG